MNSSPFENLGSTLMCGGTFNERGAVRSARYWVAERCDRKIAGDFKGETNCTRCISKLVGGFVVLDTVCVKEQSLTRPPCGGSRAV
jgi:hypothetical protein